VVASEEEEVMDCERGRVTHPATHLEIAQVSDGGGRFTDRTYVCKDHQWSKRAYENTGVECHSVMRKRV
jgi:hypothetical protein